MLNTGDYSSLRMNTPMHVRHFPFDDRRIRSFATSAAFTRPALIV